jgi:hypothetical protein
MVSRPGPILEEFINMVALRLGRPLICSFVIAETTSTASEGWRSPADGNLHVIMMNKYAI